jgi:hypothetical protein
LVSAAQFAVRAHVPEVPVMVMGALALAGVPLTVPTEQGLPAAAVIVGMVLALVVAVTLNVDW